MPLRSMSPSTVEVTSVSSMPRAAAMLASPAVRHPASACEQVLDRGGAVVGADEHRRVVDVVGEDVVVAALLAHAEVAVDRALAVGAGHPAVATPGTGTGPPPAPPSRRRGWRTGWWCRRRCGRRSRWWSLVCPSLWCCVLVGWCGGGSGATADRSPRATSSGWCAPRARVPAVRRARGDGGSASVLLSVLRPRPDGLGDGGRAASSAPRLDQDAEPLLELDELLERRELRQLPGDVEDRGQRRGRARRRRRPSRRPRARRRAGPARARRASSSASRNASVIPWPVIGSRW